MTRPIASSRIVHQVSEASYVSMARGFRDTAPSELHAFRMRDGRRSLADAMSLGMGVLREAALHELLVSLSALDVVRELVEACARRRQQHGIARRRELQRAPHRNVERA